MEHRCSGHCCKEFFLPYTPEGLLDARERFKNPEIVLIADMVKYLGVVRPSDNFFVSHGAFYTCKHFDGANCLIYETRPVMCQDYPYGRACEHNDCTMWHDTPNPRLKELQIKYHSQPTKTNAALDEASYFESIGHDSGDIPIKLEKPESLTINAHPQ